jgi:hypothetical protein
MDVTILMRMCVAHSELANEDRYLFKEEEVTVSSTEVRNEGVHNLLCPQDIVRMIK